MERAPKTITLMKRIHEIEVELQPPENHEIEEEEEEVEEEKEEVSPSQVAIDVVWLSSVDEKSKKIPKWLNSSAASTSCSIFRVPKSIMKLHSKSFQPSIVSIGPYYHGDQEVQVIEEHKWRILRGNLNRLQNCNPPVTLNDLFRVIAIKEKKIRECYSENIDIYNSHKLIEMILLDGGFIIELLCVVNGLIIPERDDPIFGFPWMLSSLIQDLLMLENQIPFFVLQIVYAKSISDHFLVPTLQELILKLFEHSVPRYVDVSILYKKYKDYDGKHILDFYRSTFLPSSEKIEKEKDIDMCCSCLPGWPSSHKEETTDEGSSSLTKKTTIGRDSTRSLSKEDIIEGPSSFREKTMDERDSTQLLAKKSIIGEPSSFNENSRDIRDSTQSLFKEDTVRLGGSSSLQQDTIDRIDSIQSLAKKDIDACNLERCCSCLPGWPCSHKEETTDAEGSKFHFIQPVEKLREAGIKFKKREEEGLDSFLEIKFEDGILEIPCITTSAIMIPLILNFIAFEQCSIDSSKHFTSYFNFMGYLINSTGDAQYLRKKKIVENFFGTDQELINFFNEVGKNIPYYYEEDYLTEICKKIEIYYRNRCNVRCAELRNKCCGTLFIGMTVCAGVFVTLLSVMQGFLALYKFITKDSK